MAETIELNNALAIHEQAVNEFISLVENVITQLRADVAALKAASIGGDSELQHAINKITERLDASTAAIQASRGRIG